MKKKLIDEFIKKLDNLKISQSIDIRKKLTFEEFGGILLDDPIMSEEDFLKKYTTVKDDFLCRRSFFKKEFDAFSRFNYNGNINGPIPESFFKFRGMLYLSMMKESDEEESLEESDSDEESFSQLDFLGLSGVFNCVIYDGTSKYDSYFEEVKSKYNKVDIVRCYRKYLRLHALESKISSIHYDNPFDFVYTTEKQFGYYYETIKVAAEQNPGAKFYIYNDGIGVGSMICILLGLPYISYETYGIGTLAFKLGIITHASIATYYEQKYVGEAQPEDVHFYGNLSNFFNLAKLIEDKKYIVIDENRLFNGCNLKDIKWSTHGRVFSNCISTDCFVSFGREISKSLPMILKKRNIPMSTKAEFYLLANGLKVYTDGCVQTCTPALTGGNYYIDTTDSIRNLRKQDERTNHHDPYLCQLEVINIISRNVTTSQYGKYGDLKHYKFVEYEYGTHEFIVDDVSAFKIDFRKYKDPRCLADFFFQDGLYFGRVKRPEYVRFLIEDGMKKYITYMRTVKFGSVEYGVYRDRNAFTNIDVDVIDSV